MEVEEKYLYSKFLRIGGACKIASFFYFKIYLRNVRESFALRMKYRQKSVSKGFLVTFTIRVL